jgi:hypothetical protein
LGGGRGGRGGRKSFQHRDEQRLFRNLEKNPVDEGNHGIRKYIEDPTFWLRFALRVLTDIRGPTELVQDIAYRRSSHRCKGAASHIIHMIWLQCLTKDLCGPPVYINVEATLTLLTVFGEISVTS